MLTMFDGTGSRREFLRIGSLGLGGLALEDVLAAKAEPRGPVTDKSVIFLFLHGGPPQAELFDPKMTAPTGIRSVTGEVKTTLPGVTYGATLEKLARWAHKTTIVRSFQTGDGTHDIKPVMGRHTGGANMGSIYARVAGTNHPVTAMPTNVALFPRAVDPSTQPRNRNFGKFNATGPLSPAYAPFIPGAGGDLQQDMRLELPRARIDDRRRLLKSLDRMKRSLDVTGALDGVDRFREQAFDTILGTVADAFDLSKEDPRVVERYDTSRLIRPDAISRKWNNYNNYVDHGKTLGKLLLLARRLCEGGCRFVTVTTNFVWDMHADQNNATMQEGMQYCGVPFDHAVSAFVEDVQARGLENDILLVTCGEMGRTPKVNNRGGRDHWGGLAPLMLAGGGLNMGQVIGQSTRDVGEPQTEPITIQNLTATIMHTLFDVGALRITRGVPVDVARVATTGTPIPGLH